MQTRIHKIAVLAGDGIGPEVIAEGKKVLSGIAALDGTTYHGRQVRCNAEGDGKPEGTFDAQTNRRRRRDDGKPFMKPKRQRNTQRGEFSADDWRDLMSRAQTELKGDIPDFSEEGWARRKPRKKK